jgi:hypothetical protein
MTAQVVNGTNFGEATAPLTVTFGGADGRLVALVSCSRNYAMPHVQLSCQTAPGVGANLRLHMIANGVAADSPTAGLPGAFTGFSFAPPRIERVYGLGAFDAETSGRQEFM